MKPTISIIIVVKLDRGVADTLAALKNIAAPARFETIVVDASGPEFLADIRDSHPEVRWIEFAPDTGQPGRRSVGQQRNLGIEASRGDIIVFIDANCVPKASWLKDLTAPIMSGEESLVAGSVYSNNPKTHVNIQPATIKDKYLGSCATINLAMTRALYEHVGPFDTSFQFGSDVDFSWRCVDRGYKIRFVPSAAVSHDWDDGGGEVKRIYKYGRSKAYLYSKHPDRMKPFADDVFLWVYLAYLALLPVTLFFPYYPLVIAAPMLRNLRSHPLKTVYLHFIYTFGFIRQGAVILYQRLMKTAFARALSA